MAFRTLTIGRSHRADIQLDAPSVSRMHAELTLTSDGRCYLTDRKSLRGTSVLRNGEWVPHEQGYVNRDANLRFGNAEVALAELLKGVSFPNRETEAVYPSQSITPRRNRGHPAPRGK